MGEPGCGNAQSPTNESIVREEGTRGSETSKYPEEKKENSISLVVASEEERAWANQIPNSSFLIPNCANCVRARTLKTAQERN